MKEGEPTYIVTQFDNYEESSEDKPSFAEASEDEPQETEKINQNIAEWKDKGVAAQSEILPEEGSLDSVAEEGVVSGDKKDQEVKIEDLPF